jgi:hypothetical protein
VLASPRPCSIPHQRRLIGAIDEPRLHQRWGKNSSRGRTLAICWLFRVAYQRSTRLLVVDDGINYSRPVAIRSDLIACEKRVRKSTSSRVDFHNSVEFFHNFLSSSSGTLTPGPVRTVVVNAFELSEPDQPHQSPTTVYPPTDDVDECHCESREECLAICLDDDQK